MLKIGAIGGCPKCGRKLTPNGFLVGGTGSLSFQCSTEEGCGEVWVDGILQERSNFRTRVRIIVDEEDRAILERPSLASMPCQDLIRDVYLACLTGAYQLERGCGSQAHYLFHETYPVCFIPTLELGIILEPGQAWSRIPEVLDFFRSVAYFSKEFFEELTYRREIFEVESKWEAKVVLRQIVRWLRGDEFTSRVFRPFDGAGDTKYVIEFPARSLAESN